MRTETHLTRDDLLGTPEIADLLPLCDFPQAGTHLECAVSGGADSTALMVLATAAGCHVTAVHVDHQLREGSHLEANIVAHNAKLLGANFRSETVTVEPGGNLEARARDARYAVLSPNVATGHTANDQAETILGNLLRGAGPAGLSGMRTGHRHPILALRREDTEQVCRTLGLGVVSDPTNDELNFRRNKIRHQIIPLLNEIAERDVVPLLVRTGEQCRDLQEFVDQTVAEAFSDTTLPPPENETLVAPQSAPSLDVAALRALPPVIARGVLFRWLRPLVPASKTLDYAGVERVLAVVRGDTAGTVIAGGVVVRRSRGRLFVA